jgi:hypothetical protein
MTVRRSDLMDEPSNARVVEPENVCLAYLSCPQDGAKAYLGALLLTDGRTRPLHFGYVAPVRPTTIQRILYGRTLDAHVKLDVVTTKLVKHGFTRAPDVLFVDAEDLIMARRVFNVPTALLSKQQNAQPGITLSMYNYNTGGHREDAEQVGRIVALLEQTVDLVDPFERMQEALKEALKDIKK